MQNEKGQKKIVIKDLSDNEIKAFLYDEIVRRDNSIQVINVLENELARRKEASQANIPVPKNEQLKPVIEEQK